MFCSAASMRELLSCDRGSARPDPEKQSAADSRMPHASRRHAPDATNAAHLTMRHQYWLFLLFSAAKKQPAK
jgi:hypothetical protein